MRRAQAQQAIDEAFADGLKHLFGVAVSSLISGDAEVEVAGRFAAGIQKHDSAHALATAEIEKIFPE